MTALSVAADNSEPRSLGEEYHRALRLVERLHRQLLDVIKDELDRQGRSDINSVQALLLFNIGDSELTAGELRTRGHYLGSNVSYNLKKLVEAGYIVHQRSEADRRSVRVRLSPEGQSVRELLDQLFERQLAALEPVARLDVDVLNDINDALVRLERFWDDHIRYRL
ncbi:MAG: MarR family transcriptional regulator [Maricaulaceae bacterium]|jgi:DNA-binding MarR family transcriptional regulator